MRLFFFLLPIAASLPSSLGLTSVYGETKLTNAFGSDIDQRFLRAHITDEREEEDRASVTPDMVVTELSKLRDFPAGSVDDYALKFGNNMKATISHVHFRNEDFNKEEFIGILFKDEFRKHLLKEIPTLQKSHLDTATYLVLVKNADHEYPLVGAADEIHMKLNDEETAPIAVRIEQAQFSVWSKFFRTTSEAALWLLPPRNFRDAWELNVLERYENFLDNINKP